LKIAKSQESLKFQGPLSWIEKRFLIEIAKSQKFLKSQGSLSDQKTLSGGNLKIARVPEIPKVLLGIEIAQQETPCAQRTKCCILQDALCTTT
jgi:hypothetical protein